MQRLKGWVVKVKVSDPLFAPLVHCNFTAASSPWGSVTVLYQKKANVDANQTNTSVRAILEHSDKVCSSVQPVCFVNLPTVFSFSFRLNAKQESGFLSFMN